MYNRNEDFLKPLIKVDEATNRYEIKFKPLSKLTLNDNRWDILREDDSKDSSYRK